MKANHHAVVQFGCTTPDTKRQACNGFAVGICEARHRALTNAFTEGGNDLDLLFAGKEVHGGLNPSGDGMARRGTLEKSVQCAIFLEVVTASGLNPGVAIRGRCCFSSVGPPTGPSDGIRTRVSRW